MRLLVVEKNNREVLAIIEDGGSDTCPAIDFLASQPRERRGSAKGFKALFVRYADNGRQGLTADLFHEVDKTEKIWEFIKGRLRVFCFEDGGGLVVLSHGALKKSQKVASKEVERAIKNKEKYLEAKQNGKLVKVVRGG